MKIQTRKTYPDGNQYWYCLWKLHRDDGPAVIKPKEYKAWYNHGGVHRADLWGEPLPAVHVSGHGGYSAYYLDGNLVSRRMAVAYLREIEP